MIPEKSSEKSLRKIGCCKYSREIQERNRKTGVSHTYTSRTVGADQSPHPRMKILMGIRRISKQLFTNFISAHDAQWTGYEHIAFQTVAGTATAESDVYVPIVCCVLFASWVRRGISLSVSCLTVSGQKRRQRCYSDKHRQVREATMCIDNFCGSGCNCG